MDGDGWVMGVGTVSSYTPIAFKEYGANGATLLAGNQIYPVPELYLDAGNLEVVPEPGTWAMMIGGLALLLVIPAPQEPQLNPARNEANWRSWLCDMIRLASNSGGIDALYP